MKIIFCLALALYSVLSEDIIPPTLPEFQNANLTRKEGQYQIVTDIRKINLVNIPDVFQPTSYSCGPSSLRAVLRYFSLEVRQSQVMAAAGTQKNKGTGPTMLENGFYKIVGNQNRSLQKDLTFYRKQGMSIDELESFVRNGEPVIVLIQIFKPEGDARSYRDYNDRGHYVVIVGMDEERYYIEDPKFYNTIMYINRSQFYDRWHDYLSTEQRFANQVGIVVGFKDGSRPSGQQKLHPLSD